MGLRASGAAGCGMWRVGGVLYIHSTGVYDGNEDGVLEVSSLL